MEKGMSIPGRLSLSMALSSGVRAHNIGLESNGNVMKNAKETYLISTAMHFVQMCMISIHYPSITLATGPISPATSTPPRLHGKAATSVVQT